LIEGKKDFSVQYKESLLQKNGYTIVSISKKRYAYSKETGTLNFTLLHFPWPRPACRMAGRPDLRGTWQMKPVSDA